MANNIIQHKRTSTSGRQPNTTNSGNSQYIAAGEFALNMADQILYTSDGTNLITVGANLATLTVNSVLANTVNAASHTVGTTFVANSSQLTITTPVSANGTTGTAGYVLTSNGATGSPYWAVSSAGVNTAAQYTWSNTQTFSNTITFNGSILANTVNATSYTSGNPLAGLGGSSSNATTYVIGNNTTNTTITTTGLTVNGTSVVANASGFYTTGVVNAASVNAASHTVGTSFVANTTQVTLGSTVGLSANGSLGTSGQVLTSNGSAVYWSTVSGGGSVNTAAQYAWTNTQSFSNTITFNGSILANTVNAVSYTTGSYGNTSTGGSTVNTTIFAVGNSSSNAWVNSTGLYINGYVVANSTGAVNALNVGGVPAANVLYNYSNQTIQDYKTFANTIVITGALQDGNNSVGGAGQVLYSNGAGVYWGVAGGGGGGNSTIVTVSGTAPLSPTVGQLWFNTVDGNLKVYNYSNGYYQWVDSAIAGNPTYNVNQNKQAIAFSLVFGGF